MAAGYGQMLPSSASLATVTFAAALGFLAGLLVRRRADDKCPSAASARSVVSNGEKRRGVLCECGVLLPNSCSAEERERHRSSNRHRANMLKLDTSSLVVVTEEVSEYRAAATKLVKPDDVVLEVGSHVGGTTKVLAGLCTTLACIDQQADLVAQARTKLPNVRFEVLDAFDTPKVLALVKTLGAGRVNKVFIDISGSRDITTVVRLLDTYRNALKPDVIIVKSQAMKRLLLRSQLWVDHPGCTGGGAV